MVTNLSERKGGEPEDVVDQLLARIKSSPGAPLQRALACLRDDRESLRVTTTHSSRQSIREPMSACACRRRSHLSNRDLLQNGASSDRWKNVKERGIIKLLEDDGWFFSRQ